MRDSFWEEKVTVELTLRELAYIMADMGISKGPKCKDQLQGYQLYDVPCSSEQHFQLYHDVKEILRKHGMYELPF